MAGLPPGIATKLCTLGKYYAANGDLSSNWTATASIDRELRWAQTGDVIEQISMQITRAIDGTASVRLPITDQSGFVDTSGSPVTGWYYTVKVSSPEFSKRDRIFQLPGSAPDPFDIDNVSTSTVAPPISQSQTYVNSVTANGVTQTGAVVLTFGSGGGSGSTTVDGITDATAIGKALLRSADANAAQGVIALDQVDNTSDANKPISTATANALAAKASTASVTTGLAAKLDNAARNAASGVAPLDSGRLLPLANQSSGVSIECVAVNGVYPGRPATPNRVTFFGPAAPASGGTTAGGGGAVDNYDRWIVTS